MWAEGRYGVETSVGGASPPIWPRLCALVVVAGVAVFCVRACRSVDRETIEHRARLAAGSTGAAAEPVPAPPQPAVRLDRLPSALRKRLAEAGEQAGKGEQAQALERYHALLAEVSDAAVRGEIEERIGALSVPLAVSRLPMPGKVAVTIQRGDSVSLLARRFGVTQEYILRANGLTDPNRIVVGRDLRVLDNPAFSIAVSRQARTLTVTLGGRFFKRYPVSVGRAGETPEGAYAIRTRVVNPSWWRADGSKIPYGHPENILGTRWLSLTAVGGTAPVSGYGIHGTWDDAAIGRDSSGGCVRMRNADVEELHLLAPLGTPVLIGP